MASYNYTFTSGDTVTPTKLNSARTVSDIVNADIKSDAAIAGSKLADGAITNAKVDAAAAIAGTKIAPDFGSQNAVTTGTVTAAKLIPTGNSAAGNGIYLSSANTLSVSTSESERMRIGSNGRIDTFVGSGAGIGIAVTATNLDGATTNAVFFANATFGSLATTRGVGYSTSLNTQNAAFTQSSMIHFRAVQGTIGAGSTVTSQFGFLAENSLTGATNNFGVRSDIASGSGRWNFYAGGTATNYFAGTVTVGTTSPNDAALLEVSSTTKGFLPPRMTTAQRDAISTPPAGLMIYNTTTNKLNVRTASSWEAVTSA